MRITILELGVIIVTGAFTGMLVAIARYRRKTNSADRFYRSGAREMLWAAVPCVILIAAAIPAVALIISQPK